MGIFGKDSKLKMFRGGTKIKKAYLGTEKIYSSGNIVTYVVDSGVTYSEEVDEGANVLAPKTFVPTKNGWDFVGWRLDTGANGDVLSNKVMGDEPITLYAVFKQIVTLTYYNNSTSKSTSNGTKYYNNGNTQNPTFTISQASKSGWTVRGWATGTAGNASVAYSSISGTAFSTNTTLYGLYYKVCTLTAKSYNSTQTAQGTAYYNSAGNTTNATCTVPTGATYSGWSWRGWSAASTTGASASVNYGNGATYTLGTSDATIYGLYYQTIYLYYNGNGASSGSVSAQSGTRYYNAYGNTSNPSFTLASNGYSRSGYSFTGWDLGAVGTTITLSSDTTAYAQWQVTEISYSENVSGGGDGQYSDDYTSTRDLTLFTTLVLSGSISIWGSYRGNHDCIYLYIDDTKYATITENTWGDSITYSLDKTIDISSLSGNHVIKLRIKSNATEYYGGGFSGSYTVTLKP